jgi:hypothetical protein
MAYVATPAGMKIVDVRDPANPVPIGMYPGSALYEWDVVVVGGETNAYWFAADFSYLKSRSIDEQR